MPLLPMSPQIFSILSALVAERAGLAFDTHHAEIFGEKVGERAVEAGFDSLLDYYYYLRYDPESAREFEKLVEALVVGETYLFRELAPLETAVQNFIVPALSTGRRPRIWCAACASGEEAYTIAMVLAGRGILNEVDLVASDISAAALARAHAARYGRRAIRTEVPMFAERWLEIEERGVMVSNDLTRAIDWRQINLLDDAKIGALGTFDVIFCRNVLIYFSDATVRGVIDRLAARLRPGGALLVGISESLVRLSTPLHCEEQDGVFLYRSAR